MQFGKAADPSTIDFKLPQDDPFSYHIKNKINSDGLSSMDIYVGCAKWNKKDLKGFYPKGVKVQDELQYYASQFNSIELNATFYNMPTLAQVEKWKAKTPSGFKFCPKITNSISHYKRLQNADKDIETYCNAIAGFEENLGCVFLQLHDNFHPKDFDRLQFFLEKFPVGIPLAVEVRNHVWIEDQEIFRQYTSLLESLNIANIIVDTAGRRDLLHMHLTNDTAFIRYVGANTLSDYDRLDEWVERIVSWKNTNIAKIYFFIHQNVEEASPLLAAHFIKKINEKLKIQIKIPSKSEEPSSDILRLF